MPTPPTTIVQLTSSGGSLQAENGPITAAELAAQGRFAALSDPQAVSSYYLHVPFCFHKCHYCDFYSIVDSRDRQGVFTDRLIHEMRSAAELGDFQPAETIFIGGGTPTLLGIEHWKRLLAAINEVLRPSAATEFTVEANPETVTAELASTLAASGVNRVSIGAQSFNVEHLKTLERWHDPANVSRSVDLMRSAGIDAINLDLIFATPGQRLDQWQADLETALALQPTHLSCYNLTYEPSTPMTVKLHQGLFEPAEQDLEAAMYHATMQRLADAGFEHYEISAWARPGSRCCHNLRYWTNGNWWPLGPSASGHVNGTRWKNVARLGSYLAAPNLPPIVDAETLDADGRVGEILMLGLRLIDGLAMSEIDHLLTLGTRGCERRQTIEAHINAELLQVVDQRLRLTDRGVLLADSVLAELI